MSSNIIPVKAFLGKYYPELLYSAAQEKYKDTKLDFFFEQRFHIQGNKVQMTVNPAISGLVVEVSGNDIQISKSLYDHPSIIVSNSMETEGLTNPRSQYNPETFSTIAYLACQNHLKFQVLGEIDEPIYVNYKSEFETFYNSVVAFEISNDVDVEIVEEIESQCALNAVTNYVLHPTAKLSLTTFYRNNITASTFVYRHITMQDNSNFSHILFGKGSSSAVDENRVYVYSGANAEFLGVVNSGGKDFHSILYIEPASQDYKVSVTYKDILSGNADVSFFPVIIGNTISDSATIEVTNVNMEEIPDHLVEKELLGYISDIVDRATLERMSGVKRFYDNKSRFLHFP